MANSGLSTLPDGYDHWLFELKARLPQAQTHNLKYMRDFATDGPELEFVQEVLAPVQQAAAQILSLHNDSFIRKFLASRGM